VVDKLITGLPEVVRAMATPLANVDKITIVSTGNDGAAGASKITGDMTKIAAQVPALFEALSGMSMNELLGRVKQLKNGDADGDATKKKSAGAASGQAH
jgi:flotillin